MINLTKTWYGGARDLFLFADWNSSQETKDNWIAEMDNVTNISASVTLYPRDQSFELEFKRNLGSCVYSAGKRLRPKNSATIVEEFNRI